MPTNLFQFWMRKRFLEYCPENPTRKQAIDLQAAILVALRKRNGGAVIGKSAPLRWAADRKGMKGSQPDPPHFAGPEYFCLPGNRQPSP